MRILTDIRKYNPDVKFPLENVKMSKKWETVLTKAIRVEPVMINGNLLSAQNRKRLYWTNIAEIPRPKDEGILIRDILEDEVYEKYYVSDKALEGMANRARVNAEKGKNFGVRGVSPRGKANTLCVYRESLDHNLIVDSRGRPDCPTTVQRANLLQFRGMLRRPTPTECARLQTVPEWYEWAVSDTQIYRMCGNGWTVKVIEHILCHIFKN